MTDSESVVSISIRHCGRCCHAKRCHYLYTGKGSEEIASKAISTGVTDSLEKTGGTEQFAVVANRIRNAVKHGGSDVAVTVRAIENGLYIADDGPGIPEEKRDVIFDYGYSTIDADTGFGLAIVEEIAEAHDWEVRVTDSDDDGARFEITGVDTVEC